MLSVDYRLAPEHPFPAAVEDALAGFRWAVAHAAELGAEPARISVGGNSAGATLAAVVCLFTRTAPARPAAQLLIFPPTDHSTPRPSHRLFDRSDPRISPLKATELSGLPAALVVTAGFDVLRDEAQAYAAALAAAGTTCEVHREPSLTHGFINLTGACPAAHRAVVAVAERWAATVASVVATR